VPQPVRRQLLRAIGSLSLLASGCGGSGGTGDLAGVGSGGTGAVFAFGSISGFGSIIVNGVRYDDSAARITDDLGRERSRAELGIGMTVEIRGTTDAATGAFAADAVRIVSELNGPIQALAPDAALPGTGTLRVLGISVKVLASTLWQNTLGLADLLPGQYVEIWGIADQAAGTLTATRIERKLAGNGNDEDDNRVRGRVTQLSPVLRLGGDGTQGGQVFDLRRLGSLPAGVQIGASVRVHYVVSGTTLLATRIEIDNRASRAPLADGSRVRLEGKVSTLRSAADFWIEGLQVDASQSGTVFVGLTVSELAVGRRVLVDATLRGGVAIAQRVERRADDDEDSDDDSHDSPDSSVQGDGREVKGRITVFNGLADFIIVDAAGRSFQFDGRSATGDDGGPLPVLRRGVAVKIHYRPSLGQLIATEIELDD
jgi:hypothetical protein